AGQVGLGDPTFAFTDVRVEATISAEQNVTIVGGGPTLGNNDPFVILRGTGGNGYLLAMDFNDGFVALLRADNGNVSDLEESSSAEANIAGFDPTAAYRLELTAIGDQLSGRIFNTAGELVAAVRGSDSTYATGFSGVGAAINDIDTIGGPGGVGRTLLATAFDNVSSRTIPEPSSLLLLIVGAGLLAGRRRRT
ncbi:MAG: PEP-CTERM sorting domain-containing protein, partial [Planctomycetota bacterium]|nr:PEP-CTERM sorting domain-containing protein [Planctomycetota bacterium]